MIAFDGVGRIFGATRALSDITFEIAAGDRIAIVGPSGSGKSSLLNIAAGLDTGYSGRVTRLPPNAIIAYAFQEPRLLPWRSVLANIEFALVSTGCPRRAVRGRAEQAIDLVGLNEAATAYPAILSGGMRQRASLGRALAVGAPLVLLDEPFSAIDEAQADALCATVRADLAARGSTLLMVTHRAREAARLADRAMVMARGRISTHLTFPRAEPGIPEVDAAVEQLVRDAGLRAFQDQL